MNHLLLTLALFLNEAKLHNCDIKDSIVFKVERLERYNATTIKVKDKWEITIDSGYYLYFANKPQMDALLYRQLSHIYLYTKRAPNHSIMRPDDVYKRYTIDHLNKIVFEGKINKKSLALK